MLFFAVSSKLSFWNVFFAAASELLVLFYFCSQRDDADSVSDELSTVEFDKSDKCQAI